MRRTTRTSNGVDGLLPVNRGSAARLAVHLLVGAILLGPPSVVFAQPAPADGGNAAAVPEPPAPGGGADPLARAQMAIDKPLMTLEEDEALRRKLSLNIRKILRAGVLNDENRQAIDEWVDWRLFRMTITEIPPTPPAGNIGKPPPKPRPYRDQLADFNKRFLQEIHGAGRFLQDNNPVAAENFRRYVLDRIIERSRKLFDNNFYVRLNVVLLLTRLNLVEGGFGQDDVAYAPAALPLLDIIRDKDQHEAVKIVAVVGLKRILLYGKPNRDRKNEIALALIDQLQNKGSMFWYPMRLAEALGCVDEPLITKNNPAGGVPQQLPFHVHELVTVMRDDGQHWIVRSEAARALGRVSLHTSVDSSLIAYEIVVYSNQMAAGYNKQPKRFYWPQCFLDVYRAFKPLDAKERELTLRVKPATLISKFESQRAISDAYEKILPMVRHVLNQPQVVGGVRVHQPIADTDIQGLTAWITANKPSADRLAPGLPPLEQTRPTAATSDNGEPSPVLASDAENGPK